MGGLASITQQMPANEPYGLRSYTNRRKIQDTLQGHIYLLTGNPSHENIKPIVIKETSKELVDSGMNRRHRKTHENYLEELRIVHYLSSSKDVDPCLCKIINNYIWSDNNNYYYAMEYCSGGDLFDYTIQHFNQQKLQNNTLTLSMERLNIIKHHFQQIVRCVYYFHCNSIAHRDLSLENIMLLDVETQKIKIIDFGVAYDKLRHNNCWMTTERVGKMNYMSPEIYDKMEYDARAADVWSIGVMFYTMLCGRFPFNRRSRDWHISFKNLIDGKIRDHLKQLNIEHMFTDEIIDLLNRIFKYEKQRITMKEILNHSFVSLGHENTNNVMEGEMDYVFDESTQEKIVTSRLLMNQNQQYLH